MAKNSGVFVHGFKAEAERLGEEYRKKLGKSIFDPLDAYKLANYLEVEVCSVYDYLDEIEAVKIVGTRLNPKDWSALWLPDKDGGKIIIHNPNHSENRQQSNIMHELAHIIRRHETSKEIKMLCMQLGLRSFNKQQEEEAKYLGGCLQITRPGLMWALKRKFTVEEISEYYNASTEMVSFRINATGVMYQRNR